MIATSSADSLDTLQKPLQVLHISAGNLYGGVETFLSTLAVSRKLCWEMEPEFAICFPGRLEDELREAGCIVHRLGLARMSRPLTILSAQKSLNRLLKSNKYDVVVCHHPWTQAVFGRVVANSFGAYVAHFHGPSGGGWAEWIARRRQPKLLLAPSKHSLASYSDWFPNAKRAVLNYPLPARLSAASDDRSERRAKLREKMGVGPNDVVIMQASRVERWKGPDVVLRALGQIRSVPGWRFWIVGSPQRPQETAYFEELKAIASFERISERVVLVGSRNDVADLMLAADVYCQGNRGPEGFSLSFLEASYCGLPIVTSDLGGASEMIDPSTGILVPREDVNALANSLERLIVDSELRKSMGAAARQKADSLCSTSGQLKRLHRLLSIAAGRSSSNASLPDD